MQIRARRLRPCHDRRDFQPSGKIGGKNRYATDGGDSRRHCDRSPLQAVICRAARWRALEELRAGRITESQLRKMLGLVRIELDGFRKSHGVFPDYTLKDFEQERQSLKKIGF